MTKVHGWAAGDHPDDKLIKITAPGHPLPARAERNKKFPSPYHGNVQKGKVA